MNPHRLDPEQWNLAHRDVLLRFALQRVSDYGAAEDLVQDTFASAWHGRAHFRGDCTERTWLTGILRNKIIDHYRRNARRPAVLASDLERPDAGEAEAVSWIERQPDLRNGQRPGAATERNEFMTELADAIEHLPAKMGRAFQLREIEGLSTEEITEELNISKANLWVLIHRAKQALGQSLGDRWADIDHFGDRLAA